MLEVIFSLWYMWLLMGIVVAYYIFKPIVKGWIGEKVMALRLSRLSKERYSVLHNILLPVDKGTAQIDHIVISAYGIFVIETKNYKGWIFGSETATQWTQQIYRVKNRFMNPIHQNYGHVKALENFLLDYKSVPIIPIVAFSGHCTLKIKVTSHVVYFGRVNTVIRKYTEEVLSAQQVDTITKRIAELNIVGSDERNKHVKLSQAKKSEVQNAKAGDICPKCGGKLLRRKGKNGLFIGCSNYPKCRFTKAL